MCPGLSRSYWDQQERATHQGSGSKLPSSSVQEIQDNADKYQTGGCRDNYIDLWRHRAYAKHFTLVASRLPDVDRACHGSHKRWAMALQEVTKRKSKVALHTGRVDRACYSGPKRLNPSKSSQCLGLWVVRVLLRVPRSLHEVRVEVGSIDLWRQRAYAKHFTPVASHMPDVDRAGHGAQKRLNPSKSSQCLGLWVVRVLLRVPRSLHEVKAEVGSIDLSSFNRENGYFSEAVAARGWPPPDVFYCRTWTFYFVVCTIKRLAILRCQVLLEKWVIQWGGGSKRLAASWLFYFSYYLCTMECRSALYY